MKLSNKFILAGFLASSSLAHGQATLTWDQTNANNAWNITDANWTGGATFVTGDNVIFNSATGETVTVATGGVSSGTMAVGASNGSWVFGGGSITSSGALTKSGTGTLTLNSANSFGSITHSGGVISLGNAGALGAGTINWTAASTLQTSALTSNVTIANAIALSGTGDRTLNMYSAANPGGTNTVELSGQITGSAGRLFLNNSASGSYNPQYIFSNNTNSFTANIQINRGGLQITSNAALGNLANTVTFDSNNGADLTFLSAMTYTRATVLTSATDFNTGANAVIASGVISGVGRLTKIGAGSLTLSNTNTYSGGTTISAGPASNSTITAALIVTNSSALGTAAVTMGNTASMAAIYTNGTNLSIANSIALSASAVTTAFVGKDATTQTYSGVISGGNVGATMFINMDTAGSGGVLKLSNTANTFTVSKITTNRGVLAISGDGSLGASTNTLFLDNTSLNGGLRFDENNINIAHPVQFGDYARINVNGKTGAEISSNITGSTGNRTLPYTISGGVLKLSGTNTFYHNVDVASGATLQLGNASALGTAVSGATDGTKVSSGGMLDLNGQSVGAESLSLSGTGISSGGALVNSSGTAASHTGTVALAADSSIGGTGDTSLSGAVSGAFALTKSGSGKLTLSGTNTYTGPTNITAGTLALSGTGSISSSSIIVGASTTFDVSGVTGGYSLASGQTISGTGLVTGAVTINGTLAPGNSPGDMSFGDNLTLAGTLNLEVTDDVATMFDRLVGDGANTLALGGLLNLNNTGYSALLGDTVTVFSNWSSITGSFSSITGTDLGGGLSWDTSQLGTLGTMTVVPESSTALLGGLGALLMLRRRRA